MRDKYALICGGTGGLGTAVVRKVVMQGAYATVPYRKDKAVEQSHKSLEVTLIKRVNFVKTDLSKETEVIKLVDAMQRIDILIQLVGGFGMGDTVELSFSEWQHLIDLNLTTTFLICKHSLRRMQEYGYGRIITIGSRAALEPAGRMAAYSTAKAAVVAFTKSIASEMRGSNITANCVLPGTIDTEANREAMGTKNINKWVKPESIAELICFLASEDAADLRGVAIPVYGND